MMTMNNNEIYKKEILPMPEKMENTSRKWWKKIGEVDETEFWCLSE